ncbi:MAG: hypothetical protein MJK15_05385 [Colwellia sp.]|nr:hypothetical protein [Colwellia sp.]
MKNSTYYLHSENVYTETDIIRDCYVLIKEGVITDITQTPTDNIAIVELGNLNLMPGF